MSAIFGEATFREQRSFKKIITASMEGRKDKKGFAYVMYNSIGDLCTFWLGIVAMITLTTAVKCRSLSASARGMINGLSDKSKKRSRTKLPNKSLLT